MHVLVAIVKPSRSIQVTTFQAHVTALVFLARDFAPVGFKRWSFGSGRASDWRQGRRECKECE